jgi:hypothetical protein
MIPWRARLVLLAGLLGLTACGGIFTPVPYTPTASLLPPTDTPTIVWFPPTDTPTAFPSPNLLPTQQELPGLGGLVFTDSFDQPKLWNTAVSATASAVVGRNRLVLSISGPGPVTISSLRSEPALGDFYAEVTAELSLCQRSDAYGLIFRAAPGDNYYRLTVNCSRQVRLERARSGLLEPLGDWLLTGDAPPGAPAQVKLGVWVVGTEMRFFLNDTLQFEARDPILHTGTLGFFAYASGTSPVTVAFSDLSVYAVTYVSPTPTPVPTRTPLASSTPHP